MLNFDLIQHPDSAWNRREVLIWALIALAASIGMRLARPLPVLNDGYQYLNVAGNLQNGRGLTTSLVHFNTERSHGTIPAPLTSFAPGYPLAVAAAGLVTRNLDDAARWISGISFAITAGLLAWGLILLRIPVFARIALTLLFITNFVTLTYSAAVLSELLFTALTTGAILTLIWNEPTKRSARLPAVRVAVPFVLIGLAYLGRYAGMLLVVPVTAYALFRFWQRRDRTPVVHFALAFLPLVPFSIVSLHNWLSTGTWRGGNEVPTYTPPLTVAADYVRSQYHLLFGEHAVRAGVWEFLVLAGLAWLAVIGLRSWNKSTAGVEIESAAWSWMLVTTVFYSAAMCYLAMRVTISFADRMFQPLLPVYLLMAGLVLSRVARAAGGAAWKVALAMLVVGCIGTNARDFSDPPMRDMTAVITGLYAKPIPAGKSLRGWVDSTIPMGEAILAGDGQVTGFVLQRPTVSLLEAHYSTVRWNCGTVSETMRTFHSQYVFLYQPWVNPALPLADESDFVRASLKGAPPCGFTIAAQTPDIVILQAPV